VVVLIHILSKNIKVFAFVFFNIFLIYKTVYLISCCFIFYLFIVYFVGFLLVVVRTVSKIFILYMIPAAFGLSDVEFK